MKKTFLTAILFVFSMSLAFASDTTTEVDWNFTNYIAKTAKTRYDYEADKAKRTYDAAVEKLMLERVSNLQVARKELVSKLKEAMDVETKGGRLEEALNIKRAIEEIENNKPIPGREEKPTIGKKNIPPCAIEWNGHSYLAVLMPVDWEKAKKLCEDMGGHLVYIEDEREMEMLKKLTYTIFGSINLWTGGTKKDNQWHWGNKEIIQKNIWATGQPNATDITGVYATIYSKGLRDVSNIMYQKNHGEVSGFICEWE